MSDNELIRILNDGSAFRDYLIFAANHSECDASDCLDKYQESDMKYSRKINLSNAWSYFKNFINNTPCPIVMSDSLPDNSGAVYMPNQGIILLDVDQDLRQIIRSLSIEMAHASLDNTGYSYSRQKNAFCAYCISYVVCQRMGIAGDLFVMDQLPDSRLGTEYEYSMDFLSKVHSISNALTEGIEIDAKDKTRIKNYEAR